MKKISSNKPLFCILYDNNGKIIEEIVRCKDCKYGHFIVPCKEAKTNHSLLRYQCPKIKGNHKPDFFCAYGVTKDAK